MTQDVAGQYLHAEWCGQLYAEIFCKGGIQKIFSVLSYKTTICTWSKHASSGTFPVNRFDADHRFTAQDICDLHTLWLSPIYSWAGVYRSVDIGKGGFQFARARLIPNLMATLERDTLKKHTPCRPADDATLAFALAEVHAELILVHPFREGNGRLARLLTLMMALQAGLPPLDFNPMLGRGRRSYIGGIHVAMGRDYGPLAAVFKKIIARSKQRAAANTR